MFHYRFELLVVLTILIGGVSACMSSGPASMPATQTATAIASTTQNTVPVSIWDLPGLPPTATPELPAVISEHDADLIAEGPSELEILQSLWLGSLPPLPSDPSNAVADNPQAAQLGHKLFFDARLSANGEVSCATCHEPELIFTDGLPRSRGVGDAARNSMTIVGAAYSPWLFWDGRRDSLWAQALDPWEDPAEHGGTRTQYVHIIDEDATYRAEYEALFGPLPDFSDRDRFPDEAGPLSNTAAQAAWEAMAPVDRANVTQVFANLGKAVAAYERLIRPGPSRFDAYVQAALGDDGDVGETLSPLTPDEEAGMRLFINDGCLYCHKGPLFTSNEFFNIGVPNGEDIPLDIGRFQGLQAVFANEFNCLGSYSDAEPDECATLTAVDTGGIELQGAFKVPSLRNVAETGPYMSSGQYATLGEVLNHYSRAKPGPFEHTEILPFNFSQRDLAQLEAFLKTLSGPLDVDPELLNPPNE